MSYWARISVCLIGLGLVCVIELGLVCVLLG